MNESTNAPQILQALISADPHTVRLAHNQALPLHRFLYNAEGIDPTIATVSISMLLEAYPDSVNIPDSDGRLPIHIAAEDCDVSILKTITAANPDNLSQIDPRYGSGSVAHSAVSRRNLENIHCIHSVMPELFSLPWMSIVGLRCFY